MRGCSNPWIFILVTAICILPVSARIDRHVRPCPGVSMQGRWLVQKRKALTFRKKFAIWRRLLLTLGHRKRSSRRSRPSNLLPSPAAIFTRHYLSSEVVRQEFNQEHRWGRLTSGRVSSPSLCLQQQASLYCVLETYQNLCPSPATKKAEVVLTSYY